MGARDSTRAPVGRRTGDGRGRGRRAGSISSRLYRNASPGDRHVVEGSMERGRARDLGIVIGTYPTGPRNSVTDVAGVRVGHATVVREPAAGRSRCRADGRHGGVPPRGAALDRTRVRGDPRAERVRRADRHQPDRRMGSAALADRHDELARDRPRVRRDCPVADHPAPHDDARGRRHAVRVRVRRLLPERRDELPPLGRRRLRRARRRRRRRGRGLRRRRDRDPMHGLQGRDRHLVADDPRRVDRRRAGAHELRRARAAPDRRRPDRSRDHGSHAGGTSGGVGDRGRRDRRADGPAPAPPARSPRRVRPRAVRFDRPQRLAAS